MSHERSLRIGFIGPGTVGIALARGFAKAGYRVTSLFGRDAARRSAAADQVPGASAARSAQEVVDASNLVFLTVPDAAVRPVAESLAWNSGTSAIHCSGVATGALLSAAAGAGAATAVFHPLQTLATPEQASRNLPGSTFAIEASTDALRRTLEELARSLSGHPVTITGSKALYHASAVLASNGLVTLLDAAAGLWTRLGLSQEQGLRALLPLVRGTVENLETIGLPNALTGPVSRGDLATVVDNVNALEQVSPEIARLYVDLAVQTIPIALAKGSLDPDVADQLRDALGIAG